MSVLVEVSSETALPKKNIVWLSAKETEKKINKTQLLLFGHVYYLLSGLTVKQISAISPAFLKKAVLIWKVFF